MILGVNLHRILRVKKAAEERKRAAQAESTAKMRQGEAITGKSKIGTFEQHTKVPGPLSSPPPFIIPPVGFPLRSPSPPAKGNRPSQFRHP